MKNPILILSLCALGVAAQAVQPLKVICREGFPVLGSGAWNITSTNNPTVTPGGKLAFTVGMGPAAATTEHGVFIDDQVVYVSSVNGFSGAESSMGLLDNGDFLYSPAAGGLDAVVSRFQGIILKGNDPAPGFAGNFATFNSRPAASATGAFFWIAGLSTTAGGATAQRAFYTKAPGGPVVPLLSTNVPVNGLAYLNSSGIGFDFDVSSNGLQRLNICNLVVGGVPKQHLVRNGVNFLAVQGDPVPNPVVAGQTFGAPAAPVINDAGQWAFRTTVILAPNPALNAIQTNLDRLEAGMTVDQFLLPNSAPRGLAMSEDGFLASVWGPTAGSILVISRPGLMEASRVIVKSGDPVDLDGDFLPDGILNSIDSSTIAGPSIGLMENKDVILEATWTPDSTGVPVSGIIRVRMPILADINKDNEVGPGDFAALSLAFGAFPSDANWDADCDLNWDGEVGPRDFAILAAEFGTFGP